MPEEKKPSPWRWLLPLLIALVALWLLRSLYGGPKAPHEPAPPPGPTATSPTVEPVEGPGQAASSTVTGGAVPGVTSASGEAPSAAMYFAQGSSILPADATGGLEPVVAWLKANPSTIANVVGVIAEGEPGSAAQLANERAAAVRTALVGAGIDEVRVALEPPVALSAGSTPADTRRVDVTIR